MPYLGETNGSQRLETWEVVANCLRELIQSRRVWLLSDNMTPEKFFLIFFYFFTEEHGLLLSWLKAALSVTCSAFGRCPFADFSFLISLCVSVLPTWEDGKRNVAWRGQV